MRRKTNSIWDIEDLDSTIVSSQELIEKAIVGHFQKLFTKSCVPNLRE